HVEPPAFKVRENSTYEHPGFSGGLPLHAAKKSVAPQVALNSNMPVCNMLPGHGFFSLFPALIHFGFITFPYPF
ncbi:hypothetical protein ACV1DR_18750, partial [Aeromonas jandaei]